LTLLNKEIKETCVEKNKRNRNKRKMRAHEREHSAHVAYTKSININKKK
jgi:hypothetical protein